MRPAVQEVYLDDTLISNLAGVSHESDIPRIGRLRRRRGRRDGVEKLDGKDARVTVEEVAIEPGGQVRPHRHAGPVFGYVLEGEYEHALDDEPVTTYKAGDTFYEPTGCVHRVTRNPSARAKTRLLAVILHPRDTEKTTVPEEAAKKD